MCLILLFSTNIDRPASLVTTPTNNKTVKRQKSVNPVNRLRQKPVLSASESALNNKNLDEKRNCMTNSSCCDCFPSPKKRWSDSGSAQMSEIYIENGVDRRVESDFSTPACLNNMTRKNNQNLLSIESEIEFRGHLSNKKKNGKIEKKSPKMKVKISKGMSKKKTKNYEIELADEACAENEESFVDLGKESHINDTDDDIIIVEERNNKNKKQQQTPSTRKLQKSISIAQESITCSSDKLMSSPSNTLPRPKGINRFFTSNRNKQNKINEKSDSNIVNNQETSFITPPLTIPTAESVVKCEFQLALDSAMQTLEQADLNGNPQKFTKERNSNTLPRMKKSHFHPSILYSRDTNRTPFKVPKRTTTDGTSIYYWCDVPKKQIKGWM